MAPITQQGGRWIQGAPGWTGALLHGALVGGTRWRFPPGGWLTRLLGRRKLYFVGPALFVACSIGQFWADTGLALFLFRFLIGIGVGFEYPVAGSMLVEFMPKKQRGPRLAMLTILWFAGAACSVVITVLFVVGCLIATKLINVIGRRSMLIHSFLWSGLALLGLGLFSSGSEVLVLVLFGAYAVFIGGAQVLQLVYPNELFPTEIRSLAVGTGASLSRVGAAVGTWLVLLSLQSIGIGNTMFACPSASATRRTRGSRSRRRCSSPSGSEAARRTGRCAGGPSPGAGRRRERGGGEHRQDGDGDSIHGSQLHRSPLCEHRQ